MFSGYDKSRFSIKWFEKRDPFIMVEAGGVEPPSENASSGTSPGADSHLHSLTQAWADTLKRSVASLCMVSSKLCLLTFAAKRRPIPSRGPLGWNGHGLSRDELNVIVGV